MSNSLFPIDWDPARREDRIKYWANLRIMKAEYHQTVIDVAGQFDMDDFYTFVENNFGIRVITDNNGNIDAAYDIVDEAKYLMYVLKYIK